MKIIQQIKLKKTIKIKITNPTQQTINNFLDNTNKNIKTHHTKNTNNTIKIKNIPKKTITMKILIIMNKQINRKEIKDIKKRDKENLPIKDIKNNIKSQINNIKKNIIVSRLYNRKELEIR